jgi:hypothetical protein
MRPLLGRHSERFLLEPRTWPLFLGGRIVAVLLGIMVLWLWLVARGAGGSLRDQKVQFVF